MATKSFKKELTFSTKTAEKFLDALDSSKRVSIESQHKMIRIQLILFLVI
ncbi:hypothetical protein JOD14_001408 [Enterococcus lemanii]|nr:hypothetical protein [Enterococcus lemanii]